MQHPRAPALTSNHPKLDYLWTKTIAGVRIRGWCFPPFPGATKGCETSHGGFRYELMFPVVYTLIKLGKLFPSCLEIQVLGARIGCYLEDIPNALEYIYTFSLKIQYALASDKLTLPYIRLQC